ncbi:MAG: ABC transporter ATP-binding protein [Oscillospiraceae bacterium]
MKQFFPYLGKYKKYLLVSMFCVTAETITEMMIPLIMTDIIDVGIKTQNQQYLIIKGIQMMVFALISLALGLVYARVNALAGMGFGAELRRAEFEKIQGFSFSNTDRFTSSSLVTRLTGDITILQNAVNAGVRPLVRGPVMLVTAMTMAIMISPTLSVVFAISIPLLGLCLFLILKKQRPFFGRMQKALDRVNTIVQENLAAIRVVKSYVREGYECQKFDNVNQDLKGISEKAFHYSVLNMPIFQFSMYATTVALLAIGGAMVQQGALEVGRLTMFLSFVLLILNSLMMISGVFLLLSRAVSSAVRVSEILNEEADIQDTGAADAVVKNGSIDFENVAFKYQQGAEEYVLSGITLHIAAGQTVGIIGGTGSAKTSLVQLIPRLYDISAGKLLIDGRDIKEYSVAHLRDAIGMVLQKNTLFTGSIRENLLCGNKHATGQDLAWACRVACCEEFLARLPEGLETQLGQGGVNVSGGQKQRLCIARALLKKPKVLILDDSTSAVDTATEAKIREGLASDLPGTTKIIIAQRISSVEQADQIVILENGLINEVGTHEKLLAHNHIYQEIVEAQKKGALA